MSEGNSSSRSSPAGRSLNSSARTSTPAPSGAEGGQFEIAWRDRAGGRKARCAPNPDYPEGIDADMAFGAPGCVAKLPYPAEHLGVWFVTCRICGFRGALTAAGRVDDPRSVTLPCKPIGKPQ